MKIRSNPRSLANTKRPAASAGRAPEGRAAAPAAPNRPIKEMALRVSGLWCGYTASNVLKWYWWRFNGFGYFWGMITGIGSALVLA